MDRSVHSRLGAQGSPPRAENGFAKSDLTGVGLSKEGDVHVKKALIAGLVMGLIAGSLYAPAAAGKKKKKPALVQVDQKMFLGAAGDCGTVERSLSLADGQDLECWYVRAGAIHDAGESVPAPAGADPWAEWAAADGLPIKLDTAKRLTGEISTAGVCGLLTNLDCLPVGMSLGQVKLSVKVTGVTGGQEKTLGEFAEEFTATPGSHHTTMVDLALDPALHGLEFTELSLWTRIGGASVGHGVYKLVDPSSFLTIPTLVPAS